MNAVRVHLKHKILKEVRLILTLIAIPMAFIIYFVMLKPTPLEKTPTICQSEHVQKKPSLN